MKHRSDQAVSSQDQPAPQAAGPRPRALHYVTAWATAFGALAFSLGVVALGVWMVRLPLAGFVIGAVLAERGAEADFRVTQLGWDHAALGDIRVGSETSPDALIETAEVQWRWYGLSPVVTSLRLLEPHLRLRIDPNGHVSAGALDRISGPPSEQRPSLPRIRLEAIDGRAEVDAPFGAVEIRFHSAGVFGQDFHAEIEAPVTTQRADLYAIERGGAHMSVDAHGDALSFAVSMQADDLLWNGAHLTSPRLEARGAAPLDLSELRIDTNWRASSAQSRDARIGAANGSLSLSLATREDALAVARWDASTHASVTSARAGGASVRAVSLRANASGDGAEGRGGWNLRALQLATAQFISDAPSATGAFSFAADGRSAGRAQLSLNRARLTVDAQRLIHGALPDMEGAPIGPTFAQARRALDAAGAAFSVTAPLAHEGDADGARIWVSGPVDARAASGASLRLTPLREDAPSVVVAWPSLAVHGAIALDMSGGGAPHASLLLDSVDWAPDAPLDADGTFSLADWRAEGASISASEMSVSLSTGTEAGGRLDLRGPTLVSGPLGDGAVQDFAADLDLTVSWNDAGWRVAPHNGCQAARIGGLEAAGLSLSNGAFSMCPLDGALIAGNAGRALSGGFTIRQLALNGHMAGHDAQPARLRAANVAARFTGTADDAVMRLQADAPQLAIDLADARTLELSLARLTGDARLGREWSVEGAFEQGVLTDPNLPGSVSALAGQWRAAPENHEPVISVQAAEALVTANRPATDAERPLFNPLRLVGASGELRGGEIHAQGALVLAANSHQLAHFVAEHRIGEGVGHAQITSDDIVFGADLQPYDITERARGLVENVRGPAALAANVNWTNSSIASDGHVVLDGVSLSTSTIPIVQNVRGDIAFDDLFALTTPPGQVINVGLVNPGVAAENGVVRFQLLGDQRVSIESAAFAFASGVLSMAPTTITMGADETRIELALSDVEAADLLARMNMPDLAVTGRVEGRFPLLLTRRSAFISGGVLRSAHDGGTIAYTGNAGANTTGAARIAFDALRSFAYDDLEITLDGDLNGEVISSITFHGRNTGRPVDLGDIARLPGVGRVEVRGVPFAFNVRVTAPFRRLAQTMTSITDPGQLLDRAQEPQQPGEVDQSAPGAEIRR